MNSPKIKEFIAVDSLSLGRDECVSVYLNEDDGKCTACEGRTHGVVVHVQLDVKDGTPRIIVEEKHLRFVTTYEKAYPEQYPDASPSGSEDPRSTTVPPSGGAGGQ